MNYYYDTEFLEGTQKRLFGRTKPTIDLISIGIVSDDNREYYAMSKDFNLKEAWNRKDGEVYWIRENVLRPIFYKWMWKDMGFHDIDELFTYKRFKELLTRNGKTNNQIAEDIKEFIYYSPLLNPYSDDYIEMSSEKKNLYGYYSAYDHVVFCWLFGKMINLPKGFPMYTKDLKQILDEKAASAHLTVRSKADGFSEREYYVGDSYNTREGDMIKYIKEHKDYPKQTNEHSAIHDARWNKRLHEFLKQL